MDGWKNNGQTVLAFAISECVRIYCIYRIWSECNGSTGSADRIQPDLKIIFTKFYQGLFALHSTDYLTDDKRGLEKGLTTSAFRESETEMHR